MSMENEPEMLFIKLSQALLFLPALSNMSSLRNWLLKRPHIRRRRGRVHLLDLLKEISGDGNHK